MVEFSWRQRSHVVRLVKAPAFRPVNTARSVDGALALEQEDRGPSDRATRSSDNVRQIRLALGF